MRWRNLLFAGGATAAGAAAVNAALHDDVPPLENRIGGEALWWEWRGHRIGYTRRGSGTPLLLVHGIYAGAWSWEFHRNAEPLGAQHTVYTVDLLGFGRSARPEVAYDAELQLALLSDFAREIIGAPTAVMGSSLGGAFAIALAARHPERFTRVIAICATGVGQLRERSSAGDAVKAFVETPVVGDAFYGLLTTRPSISIFLKKSYWNDGRVTDALVDIYHQAANQPGSKRPIAAFVGMRYNYDVAAVLPALRQPLLLFWGREAKQAPVAQADGFTRLKPDTELVILDGAGDLPHDERADEVNARVLAFLAAGSGARLGSASAA